MAFTAGEVLSRALTILQDSGSVRWTLPELLGWLNDALNDITLYAPEVVSDTFVMSLVAGVMQTNPPEAGSILRVNCNVTGVGPYVRGRTITPIKRQILDSQMPGWQTTAALPYSVDVVHFIEDEALQGKFMVVPGNTGTGKIEIVIAKRPTQIATPASPLVIESYTAQVTIDDMFRGACVDFVLYKAFQKDIAIPGGPQRAMAYYQNFQQALGIRKANEKAVNPTSDDPARRG